MHVFFKLILARLLTQLILRFYEKDKIFRLKSSILNCLNWYLIERKLYATLNGKFPRPFSIQRGVLQVPLALPLLYLMFVNTM